MVNFLVRTADFLAFAMRLVSEDILWLKDYCSSLTNWQCGLFLAYCFLFVVIVKCGVALAAMLIRGLFRFSEFGENLVFKLFFSNTAFCEGYRQGLNAGREKLLEDERDRANHPVKHWWRNSSLNPSNWF